MNKTFANFFSLFIPRKNARKKWRKIFMYGPMRAICTEKLLKKLRNEKPPPPNYYLTVCAIVKNEASYFQEWLEWHIKMGVEKFYIYDNESEDNTAEILEPHIKSGLVEYVFWAGKKQQTLVYYDCLEKHRLHARWIAFIDLDEFIVPLKDKTIPDFLKRFEKYPAVEINWLVYGSGGAKRREEGDVMDRFRYHSVPNHALNRHVKSIVNPLRVFCVDAHIAAIVSDCAVDSHGTPVKKYFHNREPQLDIIRINHYAVKSYEEFLIKRNRGRITKNKQYDLEYFEKYDLNDVKI